MSTTTGYDYEYEFIGNGERIKGTFTQKVGARNETSARRSAYSFARSKARDRSPVLVRLVNTNDPNVAR